MGFGAGGGAGGHPGRAEEVDRGRGGAERFGAEEEGPAGRPQTVGGEEGRRGGHHRGAHQQCQPVSGCIMDEVYHSPVRASVCVCVCLRACMGACACVCVW